MKKIVYIFETVVPQKRTTTDKEEALFLDNFAGLEWAGRHRNCAISKRKSRDLGCFGIDGRCGRGGAHGRPDHEVERGGYVGGSHAPGPVERRFRASFGQDLAFRSLEVALREVCKMSTVATAGKRV